MEEGVPLYLQLVDVLENDILSGRFVPGQRIPSIREMASFYAINPNTIQHGLGELKRKGLIIKHRTGGFHVVMEIDLIATYKAQKVQWILHSFLTQMESLGYTKEQAVTALWNEKTQQAPHNQMAISSCAPSKPEKAR